MKKGLTELVFILDKSGSMSGLERDTIGGFNSMIERQKKEEGECLVSLVLFDDSSEVLLDRVNVKDVQNITEKEYYARGSTALVDAIGLAIHHIGLVHRYARKEDVPDKTVFVITTDGMENASHIYTADDVKQKIKRQQEKYGWEFLFLGANIDAVETARGYGIREANAVRFHNDSKGIRNNYEVIGEAVCRIRTFGSAGEEWARPIEEDYKNRESK